MKQMQTFMQKLDADVEDMKQLIKLLHAKISVLEAAIASMNASMWHMAQGSSSSTANGATASGPDVDLTSQCSDELSV